MNFIFLQEVDSTMAYAAANEAQLDDMTLIAAARQTCGRGQRGNSWESEPGANLTCTLLHRPHSFPAGAQFAISEAAALATAGAITELGHGHNIRPLVKWPNDIYAGNSKIAGILIENSLLGSTVLNTRIGIGLNVNQTLFTSDAPNPVSLAHLCGHSFQLSETAAILGHHLEIRLGQIKTDQGRKELHKEFLRNLWRADGHPHPFRRRSDGALFEAAIQTVLPDGPLILQPPGNSPPQSYLFKEVEFLLNN